MHAFTKSRALTKFTWISTMHRYTGKHRIWKLICVGTLENVHSSVIGCFVGKHSRVRMNYSAIYVRILGRKDLPVRFAPNGSCVPIIFPNMWKHIATQILRRKLLWLTVRMRILRSQKCLTTRQHKFSNHSLVVNHLPLCPVLGIQPSLANPVPQIWKV